MLLRIQKARPKRTRVADPAGEAAWVEGGDFMRERRKPGDPPREVSGVAGVGKKLRQARAEATKAPGPPQLPTHWGKA